MGFVRLASLGGRLLCTSDAGGWGLVPEASESPKWPKPAGPLFQSLCPADAVLGLAHGLDPAFHERCLVGMAAGNAETRPFRERLTAADAFLRFGHSR